MVGCRQGQLRGWVVWCVGSLASVWQLQDSHLSIRSVCVDACVCESCVCRWRTALVIRELEAEVVALAAGRPHRCVGLCL